MFTPDTLLFFIALLTCAVILEPLCGKMRIPFPIVLVIIGYAGSEITTRVFDIDTGIRWYNFHTIIFYGLIPVLIFQAALTLNIPAFKRDIIPISVMAFPVMLLASALTGTAIYFAINHPVGFPWVAALLTGALLSATDPAAVLAVLKDAGTPERVQSLLEGESLLNDAMAIVLFIVLLSMAVEPGNSSSWTGALERFCLVFAGGVITGLVIGIAGHLLLSVTHSSYTGTLITVLVAYGSYIIAENRFHVSGVMAVLSAGLMLRYFGSRENGPRGFSGSRYFWEFASYLSEMLIFILAGITITLSMFTDQWLAILIGIMAVLSVRYILVYPMLGLMGKFPGTEVISRKEKVVVVWGGVRGTVTLALALSLPLALDYYYTIQSIAYGVVLFTLFVQATTIGMIVKGK